MTENQNCIYESIQVHIRSGFLPIEDIMDYVLEEIEDSGFEEDINEEWVEKAIQYEYQKLLKESQSWKQPNDTDKLISAFDDLCLQNFIALHSAGCTISDGENEVVEVEVELRNNGFRSEGYCFYHGQDLANAILSDQSTLYITFQKIDNEDEAVALDIGRKICETLNKHGLNTYWDMMPASKIELLNFRWQKIFNENDRDLLDYNSVVEMIIG